VTMLPDVRRQLIEAADRQAVRRRPWRARTGLRRGAVGWRRGPLIVLAVLLGTGATAYAAVRLLSGSTARNADTALHSLIAQDPACGSHGVIGHISERAPSPELQRLLGVLRRPATAQDALPKAFSATLQGGDVYVRYIRRAQVAFGQTYYVIPSGNWQSETPPARRCLAEARRELPHLPAAQRATALAVVAQSLRHERHNDQAHEAVCLISISTTKPLREGSDCGISTAQVADGQDLGSGTEPGQPTLISALVPDGVATVTMVFPPTSDAPQGAKISTRPEGNVVAVRVPASLSESIQGANPSTIVWRSATGKVLRTINEG
jgi:hypothetical protein